MRTASWLKLTAETAQSGRFGRLLLLWVLKCPAGLIGVIFLGADPDRYPENAPRARTGSIYQRHADYRLRLTRQTGEEAMQLYKHDRDPCGRLHREKTAVGWGSPVRRELRILSWWAMRRHDYPRARSHVIESKRVKRLIGSANGKRTGYWPVSVSRVHANSLILRSCRYRKYRVLPPDSPRVMLV
jgi:hypothetical protein